MQNVRASIDTTLTRDSSVMMDGLKDNEQPQVKKKSRKLNIEEVKKYDGKKYTFNANIEIMKDNKVVNNGII